MKLKQPCNPETHRPAVAMLETVRVITSIDLDVETGYFATTGTSKTQFDTQDPYMTPDGNVVVYDDRGESWLSPVSDQPFSYPESVMILVRQRMGLDADDSSMDHEFMKLPPVEILRRICGWLTGDPALIDEMMNWMSECFCDIHLEQ